MFSESSNYVALDNLLAHSAALTAPAGSLVIAAPFLRGAGSRVYQDMHRLIDFRAKLARTAWVVREEHDFTDNVAPTLRIGRMLIERRVVPSARAIDEYLADLGAGIVCSCASSLESEYVIRTDGAVLAETSNSQIAILDTTTSAPLAPVANLQGGQTHGCASLADSHTAWCWRSESAGNALGQLGNGTTDSGPLFRATKVLKGANQPLTDVAFVATGNSNTACAVLSDTTAYCWGDVAQVLNGGTTLNSGYALRVTLDGTTPLTGVKQMVLGLAHACALVEGSAADEVWCWGYDRGNLGLGTATGNGNSQYPKKIVGLTRPSQLAIANGGPLSSTTCARDGENVRCWGSNNNQGSVGVPSSTGTFVSPPALVTTSATGAGVLDGVVEIQSGTYGNAANFCGRRTDGTLWCWGTGYTPYASPYVVTNVVDLGWTGDPRFLTSDGLYHVGATTRELNCGQL
ncbi:MAG: hypothetical protein ABI488_16155 [Polyangiaceae bacterium]